MSEMPTEEELQEILEILRKRRESVQNHNENEDWTGIIKDVTNELKEQYSDSEIRSAVDTFKKAYAPVKFFQERKEHEMSINYLNGSKTLCYHYMLGQPIPIDKFFLNAKNIINIIQEYFDSSEISLEGSFPQNKNEYGRIFFHDADEMLTRASNETRKRHDDHDYLNELKMDYDITYCIKPNTAFSLYIKNDQFTLRRTWSCFTVATVIILGTWGYALTSPGIGRPETVATLLSIPASYVASKTFNRNISSTHAIIVESSNNSTAHITEDDFAKLDMMYKKLKEYRLK